jgi:hypothetical protein
LTENNIEPKKASIKPIRKTLFDFNNLDLISSP